MPLFRFHRGGLQDSLNTTVIVKNLHELLRIVLNASELQLPIDSAKWPAKINIEPYPSEENCFDSRIGWYTQIVTVNLCEEDKMHPVGFLSEPL